ncbi:OLC1v1008493C4 [Oldenlandia corymbosa var. corymbosa]|nr:OLC1v1008493C4 [Oldenlandia corymbosa var. corymbosa]
MEWSYWCSKFLESTFRSFDLNKVLEFGPLLASWGQEYDIANDGSKNPRERLARQKQNLRRRLGLDVCEQFMDVNDMIRDEDLLVQKIHSTGNGVGPQYFSSKSSRNIQQFVSKMAPGVKSRRPSARELNLLKRKAKISSKDQAKGWSKDGNVEPEAAVSHQFTDTIAEDDNVANEDEGVWPFQSFVEQLLLDIFDPVWEVRHGSIMALREILSYQGASAGIIMTELNSDTVSRPTLEYIGEENTRKRSMDLNLQTMGDECQPTFKRPKIEVLAYQLSDTVTTFSKDENLGVHMSVDPALHLPVEHANGESALTIKEEGVLQPDVDGAWDQTGDVGNSRISCEEKVSFERTDILNNLPKNPELLNLVKLARHSWYKNCEFLQDCAVRFLCVLSLDRFGDYVSDQVVAPVRETCAQALGAVLKFMHPSLVHETLKILLQMQRSPEWEIRHGSLLGIKYLVAVRQEMLGDLLVYVIPACKAGLEDPDDDVRAVAADALLPTASAIVSLKGQILHSIVMLLWDILLDLDDLSPSTSSVMNLLAELYSQEQMFPKSLGSIISSEKQGFDLNEISHLGTMGEEVNSIENLDMLSTLAPRLWPFMRHSITSVRYSAIRTLERLLEAGLKKSISVSSSSFWPSSILGDTLRIVFQNLLLESNGEILECTKRVWGLLLQSPVEDLVSVVESYFFPWIELATTSYGSALDATKMFWPVALPRKSHFKAAAKMKAVKLENDTSNNTLVEFSEGTTLVEKTGDSSASAKIVVGDDEDVSVTRTRVVSATALGLLVSKLHETSLALVTDPLWRMLTSLSGVRRQVAAMIFISWFKELKARDTCMSMEFTTSSLSSFRNFLSDLLACTNPAFPTKDSVLPYSELSRTYAKMRNEASQLYNAAEASGILDPHLMSSKMDIENLTADDAINFASKLSPVVGQTIDGTSAERCIFDELESSKHRLLTTAGYLKCIQGNLHITVSALIASAVVWMSELPPRLNPIILPLMASVKREQEEILQSKAAESLAELISSCIGRKPGPNEKLIKNLCGLMCLDPCETPQAAVLSCVEVIEEQELLSSGSTFGKQKSKVHMLAPGEDRSRVEGFISRRGSELALKCLCQKFGGLLFDKLPKLWDCLVEILRPYDFEGLTSEDEKNIDATIDSVKDPQILINNIQVVRSITPLLDETLRPKLLTLLPCIFRCVRHTHVAIRLAASRCIMTMAKSMTENVMGSVIANVIPMLSDTSSVHARQGAGMLVSLLVQGLGMELVPYAPLLVVPLLGCMSDCDSSVRQSVTHSFAALVPLLPLARGVPEPAGLSTGLTRNKEDAQFLEQLIDNSQIDDYNLCTELKVTLRRYQQEGINWLAFLKRFNLHGVLCDDMGLGKTLQASAIVASDVAERAFANSDNHYPPSIIICPSTLVAHWVYEIEKFIDNSVLTTLQYVGSAQDRISLQSQFDKHNVIVTSYDVVRKDIDYLKELFWNYCILDEGHIIKNSKSKVTIAVKQLKSQHRLILSGTPIQNNVLDLWSLFDFLMPGFLGTERQFQATYGKPLLAARDSKCSAKDAEAGALAMEALHKQVMPFLLRRTKDEVLSDLPEKIIQDRYCDLSPLQLKLYEQFSGSHVKQEISSMVKVHDSDAGEVNRSTKPSSHVFQALQYLLKLCSHPLLVLPEKFPETLSPTMSELFPGRTDYSSELHNIHHSPKLVALQEILEECGIGIEGSNSEGSVGVGEHRVLIFAQHKALLDIIERDLFRVHMKNVTYLRLDGSVEPEKRFDIVKAFNSDPTIDALLLTTHVGGLGLNLTSADTLVFMEHDWNPMRDHQAMDRAHRLGQKKVVNVHRLIMRGTLEEKVMSLQRFKVSVANAVINADNASLKTMNTDQLLDLFTKAENTKGAGVSQRSTENSAGEGNLPGASKGLKKILGGLEELWDQSQYTEEYDLSQFLSKLNG